MGIAFASRKKLVLVRPDLDRMTKREIKRAVRRGIIIRVCRGIVLRMKLYLVMLWLRGAERMNYITDDYVDVCCYVEELKERINQNKRRQSVK